LQYNIFLDQKLIWTDLAFMPRDKPVYFSTKDRISFDKDIIQMGSHIVKLEVIVPLPGGYEDTLVVTRQFHVVPEGHKVVKLSLPKAKQKRNKTTTTTTTTCNMNDEAQPSRIIAPKNASVYGIRDRIEFHYSTSFLNSNTAAAIIDLDGERVELPQLGTSDVGKSILLGLRPGRHVLKLVLNNAVADHVDFEIRDIALSE
jgi:hypothetical protein